jgi:two-component system phosphate regulon response regulator OmpR
MAHILVVDDDTRLRELLQKYLSDNGFRITTARDAVEARAKLRGLTFDLIVLDVMMPGENGLELTAALKAVNPVPILLLTAMGEGDDRIAGLERGADEYLTKPFEPRELVLRIANLLRRAPRESEGPSEIRLGDCRFDMERGELFRGEKPVRLTRAEARLLKTLAARAGNAISREDLSRGTSLRATARAVDVHVTRLRRKIEADPKAPRYLQTVRGKGYALWPD